MQVAQQARWYPIDIFCRDIKTRKLRHALLQGQLLGTEIMADDQLDPRMTAMLRKSPRVCMCVCSTCQYSDVLVTLSRGQ